jgi:hypothetical protein
MGWWWCFGLLDGVGGMKIWLHSLTLGKDGRRSWTSLNFDERNQQDNSIDCCCNHLCWRVLPVVKKQSEQSAPTQALASAPTAEFFFSKGGPLYWHGYCCHFFSHSHFFWILHNKIALSTCCSCHRRRHRPRAARFVSQHATERP